jgi:two-component sensor histidine kinase
MNPIESQAEWQRSLMAKELGIFSWQYLPEENHLRLDKEAMDILGAFGSRLSMEDFMQVLSPESLGRFTSAVENALNFGSPFSLEVLAETSPEYRWLQITGRKTENPDSSISLEGFIRDISQEKQEKSRLEKLESWIHAGLGHFRVSDASGEILAQFGSLPAGKYFEEGPGKRTVELVDFRNQLKYRIEAETGTTAGRISHTNSEAQEPEPTENELNKSLSRDEQIIALTRTLGVKTDSQVSAMGIFDGSRFEWKAWWKNPSGTAVPAGKYGGEWLPDLSWLLEMETENQQEEARYWWPQDLLPFPIADDYGKGWMLLTDRLGSGETGLLALRSKSPDALLPKKDEVLHLLRYLQDMPGKSIPSTDSEEKLREEIKRKEILLKELNHRAKNNLALAAGLVKMQAGYADNRETSMLLKLTQKRLETLASIHELMYLNPLDTGEVEIQDYLHKLVFGLQNALGHPGIKLEMQIDPANIGARYATTIGLLVNELVANAFKYAFQEDKEGLLRIDFLNKEAYFKLRVSDDGPGFDSSKEKTGESLGRVLIEEFVRQLGADMELSHKPGTTYLISIKKSNIGL